MTFNFGFIGWCKDEEENHDKIWGYFFRPSPEWEENKRHWNGNEGRNVCIFWGRRGKAMQFKPDWGGWELDRLVASKKKKGYVEINSSQLIAIWPTFDAEASVKLSFEVLVGNVK